MTKKEEKKFNELKTKYDELVSYLPKVPTEPYLLELQAKYDKCVEALKFYADGRKWQAYHPNLIRGNNPLIYSSDVSEIKYEMSSTFSGGKLARQVLKELGEM